MPIRFPCPQCKKVLKVSSKHAGKRGKCPDCEKVFRVPEIPRDPTTNTPDHSQSEQKNKSTGPVLDPFADASSAPNDDFLGDLNAEDFADYPSARSATSSKTEVPQEEEWGDTYSLSESIDDAPAPALPQLNPIRKKKKKKRTPEFEQEIYVPKSPWKDSLILLFGLAMIPLAISIFSEDDPIMERLTQTFGEETVAVLERVDAASDPDGELERILDEVPGHKLIGAHLGYDTWMHWGYALLSAGIFFGVLVSLSNREIGFGKILLYGLITGTVGIVLLLGFQWVAFATQGVWVRGRGVVVLLFYLVKFIGFSYSCALNPDNGFAMSFMGFTLGVGLCEELVKAGPVLFYLKDFEKPTWRGALMVGLASGIGFGISEGINYSSAHYNGYAGGMIYLVRFASCVSLHAVWAGTVAMLMFQNESRIESGTEEPDLLMFLINYLLVVMILHGLYDTLLKKDMAVGALGIAAMSLIWMAILFYRGRRTFEAEFA